MSDSSHELNLLIKKKAANRLALVISDKDLNLNSPESVNQICILEIATSNAAGGRGAGYGSRGITRIHCFRFENRASSKMSEISDKSSLEGFLPPHHVSLLPITLDDGTRVIVYGAVDPALVSEYNQRFGVTIPK